MDLSSWADLKKGVLVQLFSISFGTAVLGLAYMVFGVPYVLFQPAYSVLPYPFESTLNSLGIYFFMGWFIGFLIMTVVVTEKEEIESFAKFFLGSFFIGVVSIGLMTGLNFINGFVWGLILSVLGVMIMYLIKLFSEYNEWW
ncbi:nucleoside transporter permease [Sulfolobus sp. SCGC AB-777_G06]|nr:nucleoside transporter permease [Sulfolobus sp. SCGC AB-777_G06]